MTKLDSERNEVIESNSITYEIFEKILEEQVDQLFTDSASIHVMYDEESKSNKRFHQEHVILSLSISTTLLISTNVFILEQSERTIRKKSQKRIKKKSNSQSLVSMFDDVTKSYE
jgi:hypothetical protein